MACARPSLSTSSWLVTNKYNFGRLLDRRLSWTGFSPSISVSTHQTKSKNVNYVAFVYFLFTMSNERLFRLLQVFSWFHRGLNPEMRSKDIDYKDQSGFVNGWQKTAIPFDHRCVSSTSYAIILERTVRLGHGSLIDQSRVIGKASSGYGFPLFQLTGLYSSSKVVYGWMIHLSFTIAMGKTKWRKTLVWY